GPIGNSCLNALIVALDETCDGKSWYTSTMELQLASLDFCIACRNYQTVHLKVDTEIPRRLLASADAPPPHPKRLFRTRVPRLRARRVTWNMRTAVELRNPIFALTDVNCLVFGGVFEGSLEAVAWPRRLKTIDMHDSYFDKPIDLVEWPASLQQLNFFSRFNQPIAGVVMPTSLQVLDLGEEFNHPIEDMVWPPSLLKLNLGYGFTHPIQRVVFPSSLEELTILEMFDQPIEGVLWPDSLQRLVLGSCFNQPIDNVRWPASLQEISFASCKDKEDNTLSVYADFNQSIGSSVWPASLRRLTLGEYFRQSLQGLGTWMPNLEALRLLDYRYNPGSHASLLREIEWPKGLRYLTVLEGSNLDGVTIPSVVKVDFPKQVW
ncbi:unnamed protein product, partial [Ectocarpus sp. 6 AP-2014]